MIDEETLFGIVDVCAETLAARHPDMGGEIALRSAEIKLRLRGSLSMLLAQSEDGPALCFALCNGIELLLHTPDSALQHEIALLRTQAQSMLLSSHYESLQPQDPAESLQKMREQGIATLLSPVIAKLQHMQLQVFGPEWLKDALGEAVYCDLKEYCYDLEADKVDWTKISALLPHDIRHVFDARDLGEIPAIIKTEQQFWDTLHLLEQRGFTRTQLRDVKNIGHYILTMPGVRQLLEYFEPVRSGQRKPPTTP